MKKTLILISFLTYLISDSYAQNYFSGELFEAYEWDLETINKVTFKLENELILRRRLLNKKEKRLGRGVKENGQYFDEIIIKRKNDLKIVDIENNILEVSFSKHPNFTLHFAPNNKDNENYVVLVEELKGNKGVVEYQELPFRILKGSRLLIGRLRKKHLPTKRVNRFSAWKGNATAIMIDTKGYLITNYHVVEDSDEIAVVDPQNKNRDLKAEVLIKDKTNDLVILKITDENYTPSDSQVGFSFGSGIKNVGAEVFTLGYPMALDNLGNEVKFADGSISSKTGYNDEINIYQISVPTQPGNSGGPLFDKDGQLIGIINSKIVDQTVENVSYAIKISYVKSLIEAANEEINIPSGTSESDLESLIKQLDNFVFMVKVD